MATAARDCATVVLVEWYLPNLNKPNVHTPQAASLLLGHFTVKHFNDVIYILHFKYAIFRLYRQIKK